nr:phage tail protein [Neisseria sp. 74A18]
MHAIDTPDKQFKDGNGTSELGTILPAWWLNQIQAELLAVLTAANIQPNKAKTNQIADAIKQIFSDGVVNSLSATNTDKPLSAAMGKKLAEEKIPNTTQDFMRTLGEFNPSKSGFVRTNGGSLNGNSLPSMEIHVGHPSYANGAYSRGIGFAYGTSWGIYTTAWDATGNYRGYKEILTEENGVMLTGDQTINGGKTFGEILTAGRNNHWGFLRNPVESGGHWVFETNPKSNYADGSTLKVNIKYEQSSGQTRYIHFPELGSTNHTVAYQDWVTTRINAATGGFDNKIEQAAPAGTVAYFAGRNAPAGWLKANGAAVSRTTYAGLFAAIGTTYGAGDGRTTFNLPDLRGEFVRGWDDGRNIDRGRAVGSNQSDNIAEHRHATGWRAGSRGNEFVLLRSAWSGQSNITADVVAKGGAQIPGHDEHYVHVSGSTYANSNDTYATSSTYYDKQGETYPRNVALLACIKI